MHFWPTADVPLRTCSESLPRLHHLGLACCCEVGWSSEETQCSAGCVLRAYGRHSPLNPPRSSPSRWATSSSASCRSRASASTRPTGEPFCTPTHAPLEPACTITSQQHGISGLSVDLQFREARFRWVQRAAAVARLDTMRRLAAGVPSRVTATAWAAATTLAWATTCRTRHSTRTTSCAPARPASATSERLSVSTQQRGGCCCGVRTRTRAASAGLSKRPAVCR